jgi:hypothetical protein
LSCEQFILNIGKNRADSVFLGDYAISPWCRCPRHYRAITGANTVKKLVITLMLAAPVALAVQDPDEMVQHQHKGPSQDEVELIEVREAPLYGADNPLVAKIKNKSAYYLDRVAIECEITDSRSGFRVFKDIVFKSNSTFTIKTKWPIIDTPELGIPPNAVTDVGLYTEDTHWSRGGAGKYRYNCSLYGVSGKE